MSLRAGARSLLTCCGLLSLTACVTPTEEPSGAGVMSGAGTQAGVEVGGVTGEAGETDGGRVAGVEGGSLPMGGEPLSWELPPTLSVATYNVQNLFDLIDDPEHIEGEYTPSPGLWNEAAYEARLNALARVVVDINADLLVLQEVESEAVLSDLAARVSAQGGKNYEHLNVVNSQDPRGISLAALSVYPLDRALGRPINANFQCANGLTLDGNRPEARPIYEVSLWGVGEEAAITLLVNHWKSKAADPEPCAVSDHHKRAGEQISGLLEAWLESTPRRAVLVLGDFNAWETEASLVDALGASPSREALRFAHDLYNAWGELGVGEPGVTNNATNSSYYFDGAWRRLDHIMLTRPMLNGSAAWQLERFEQVRPAFVMRDGRPYRWDIEARQGFSDHFPIKVTLRSR